MAQYPQFRFTVRRCPVCHAVPGAVRERVYGDAYIQHTGNGRYEYAGETEIDWDSQEPALSDEGRYQVVCSNRDCGHIWETDLEGETLT